MDSQKDVKDVVLDKVLRHGDGSEVRGTFKGNVFKVVMKQGMVSFEFPGFVLFTNDGVSREVDINPNADPELVEEMMNLNLYDAMGVQPHCICSFSIDHIQRFDSPLKFLASFLRDTSRS